MKNIKIVATAVLVLGVFIGADQIFSGTLAPANSTALAVDRVASEDVLSGEPESIEEGWVETVRRVRIRRQSRFLLQ